MKEKCLKLDRDDCCFLHRSYSLFTAMEIFDDKQAEQPTALLNKA